MLQNYLKKPPKINWNESVTNIYNLVRGLSPYPAAYTEFKDKHEQSLSVKIFSCEKESESHIHAPGFVMTDLKSYIKVACSDGFISIKDLQMAGKKTNAG